MPRFRTGHRVPLIVYDGDRPIFQAHSEESAAELVRLLNLGVELDALGPPVILEAHGYEGGRVMAARFTPIDPDAPPSAHESPSEPPAATGQPADDSGPPRCLWRGPLFAERRDYVCPVLAARWVERKSVDSVGPFVDEVPLCSGHADEAEGYGWRRGRSVT